METQRKQIIRLLLAALLLNYVCLCLILLIPTVQNFIHPPRYIKSEDASLEITIPFEVDGEADEKVLNLTRGTEVRLRKTGELQSEVEYDGQTFNIDNSLLAESLEDAVDADYVYPRRLLNLREEKGGKLSDTVVAKGEAVKVVSADPEDLNEETGVLDWYEVEKDGKNYWISGQYVEGTKDASLKEYGSSVTYSTYWDDFYGDGYSKDAYINQIDYKPVEKKEYEGNPLPTDINSIHVSLENLINNKEALLSLKETSGINSFVVELKGDGGNLFYDSKVPQNYMDDPEKALTVGYYDLDYLKELFKEFQDAGFYMIARIVTFKDAIYAEQNPDKSMVDKKGELVLHNDEYWPSPYSRDVWQYNVDIAKEVAPLVNEIEFDYVRFPDGTLEDNLEGNINFHNKYNESKVAALQGFLSYAREELAPYNVYVAADVFAWPVVAKDDQDIGQYLPALANAVDVICPMPYADHFSQGAMGIEDPVSEPEKTMYEFTSIIDKQLKSLESPPVYRTWIMGYGDYGPQEMKEQIDGINKAGYEGYIVWSGAGDWDMIVSRYQGLRDSSLETYQKELEAEQNKEDQ